MRHEVADERKARDVPAAPESQFGHYRHGG